ncbi:hypothetical protein ACJ73_06151 [Blastomyces percursus]|uniref:Uncharacterized protein n=1 Tax=Blastomyces percursus TaxID=1658174 RepID=A0A1J9Q1Q3_9EURO|nr:hypothetical protein ACJ73_06151 [Blastomyces percursus]
MHGATLLAQENKVLRAANEKQKRKRGQGRTYIGQGAILTREEGLARAQAAQDGQIGKEIGVGDSDQPTKKRAPPRCSKCNVDNTCLLLLDQAESLEGGGGADRLSGGLRYI